MQNNTKKYLTPEIEVVQVSESDVITTSGGIGTETTITSVADAIWSFGR